MAYRGTEEEALANLTANVSKRLRDNGLQSFSFEARSKDVENLVTGEKVGRPSLFFNLQRPPDASPDDQSKAASIVEEEKEKYFKQRANQS